MSFKDYCIPDFLGSGAVRRHSVHCAEALVTVQNYISHEEYTPGGVLYQ